jgi:acyl-CoA synthetase (NDP forming)
VRDLEGLFHPRSVALIGATDRSRWSWSTFENLRRYSPELPVYCVNPRYEQIHGQPAYSRLSAIDGEVDLAYVMVPTGQVLPVLREAAEVGARHAVVLTAGFAEMGPAGQALETEMVRLAEERGITLLGPNGNGFINASAQLAPYGLPIAPPLTPGPVGIVLQSGGLASVVLQGAQARGIGVSFVVSMGNEAMVRTTDVLEYLVGHPPTRAIALFLEGIREAPSFRAVAQAALEAGKPIVCLKVGRTAAGTRAALAHTGALAGDDAVVDAALRQLGVIRVSSLEDLLAVAGCLAYHPELRGRRLGVVAASGGACDIIADRATDEDLELPEFPEATVEGLRRVLPEFANLHNPLDVTGYVVVDPTISQRALEVVAHGAPGSFDVVMFQANLPRETPVDPEPLARRYDALAGLMKTSPVPVVLQTALSSDLSGFARKLVADHGWHLLGGIEHGMTALGRTVAYHEQRERLLRRAVADAPAATSSAASVPPGAAGSFPFGVAGVWAEHQLRPLLEVYGIPLVPARLARSVAEARAAAAELGDRLVLKVAAPGLEHRSDLGGVRLGVSLEEVDAAYSSVVETVRRARPELAVEGVLVSPLRQGGVELLVGVTTDAIWGKVLTVGLGGVWVEVLSDVSLRLLPVSRDDVRTMLGELRGAPLLQGARGSTPVDVDRVVEVVESVARLSLDLGDALDSLELNPLLAQGERVEALDALAVWAEQRGVPR